VAQLTIDGTLTEAPQTTQDGGFPSTTTVAPFAQAGAPTPKNVNASTGRKLLTIASPSSFAVIVGGTDADPTQMSTVYARVASGGFQVRVTFNNPLGSPIVSVLPLAGLLVLEPDAGGGYYVTKVEVQGSGQIELYASGAS
jgi:hypothetical protein